MDTGFTAAPHSSVGSVTDVAARSTSKCVVLGVLWCFWSAIPIILVAVSINIILYERSRGIDQIAYIGRMLILAGAPTAWWLLSTGIRRFQAAFQKDCYLRAGVGGVSLRVPGAPSVLSLGFSYHMKQRDLPWHEIRTWYPHVFTVNGIPMGSEIVFETAAGEIIRVPTYLFKGWRDQIAWSISEAAKAGA